MFRKVIAIVDSVLAYPFGCGVGRVAGQDGSNGDGFVVGFGVVAGLGSTAGLVGGGAVSGIDKFSVCHQ